MLSTAASLRIGMTPEDFIKREQEVREAHSIFPDLEIGEAYRQYKEAKGETASMLHTDDLSLQRAKAAILKTFVRPCTQPGCDGEQLLEGVCEGCVEGKAGFKSKWTCKKCMYRELSKRPYLDWYEELK
jgi:hypothetical protein